MTRSQRKWHVWAWMLLGPVLVAAAIAGAGARRDPPAGGAILPTEPAPVAPFVGPQLMPPATQRVRR